MIALPSVSFSVFFFQAEDVIRDAQESRGLGDVYKRQAMAGSLSLTLETEMVTVALSVFVPSDA